MFTAEEEKRGKWLRRGRKKAKERGFGREEKEEEQEVRRRNQGCDCGGHAGGEELGRIEGFVGVGEPTES